MSEAQGKSLLYSVACFFFFVKSLTNPPASVTVNNLSVVAAKDTASSAPGLNDRGLLQKPAIRSEMQAAFTGTASLLYKPTLN